MQDANIACTHGIAGYICAPFLPVVNNTGTYFKLTLQAYNSNLPNCTSNSKVFYIQAQKASPRVITLKGITWQVNDLHVFCDTTTWLPIKISPPNAIIGHHFILEEMEPARNNKGWKPIQRYGPATKTQWVYVPEYGSHVNRWKGWANKGEENQVEANAISNMLRFKLLDKDKTWRISGYFDASYTSYTYSFLFSFADCPTAMPLGAMPINRGAKADTAAEQGKLGAVACLAYPMPVLTNFTLLCSCSAKNMCIFDVQGKMVTADIQAISANKHTIDCTAMQPGMYVLKIIQAGGQSRVIKFIKI